MSHTHTHTHTHTHIHTHTQMNYIEGSVNGMVYSDANCMSHTQKNNVTSETSCRCQRPSLGTQSEINRYASPYIFQVLPGFELSAHSTQNDLRLVVDAVRVLAPRITVTLIPDGEHSGYSRHPEVILTSVRGPRCGFSRYLHNRGHRQLSFLERLVERFYGNWHESHRFVPYHIDVWREMDTVDGDRNLFWKVLLCTNRVYEPCRLERFVNCVDIVWKRLHNEKI